MNLLQRQLTRQSRTHYRWAVMVVAIVATVGSLTFVVRAASTSDYNSQSINDLQSEKSRLDQLIKQKQAAAASEKATSNTAKAQMAKLDADIAALQKVIAQTNSNIAQTTQTISQLESNINDKQTQIDQKVEQVRVALRQFYKIQVSRQDMGYMSILFSEQGLSQQARTKASYASVKTEIQRRQDELSQAKQQLADQKSANESKKATLANYVQQQSLQKQSLAVQENQAAALKANADQAFAQLSKEAQAALQEENRIEATITAKIQAQIKAQSGLSAVARAAIGTPVSQGDVIGLRGSTGFSTGPHVHFGVYTPEGATVNPRTRLGNQYIWPVDPYTVTQEYGAANWSNSMYTFHNGIDLAGPAGSPVHAAADGRIIIDDSYGAYGCAVVIRHDDGWLTLYGHMQCK